MGEAKSEAPADFLSMSRLGILEKGGHNRLRSFDEFYRIYYGDDAINRKPVTLEFEVPQLSTALYHPSILEIHNSGEFAVRKASHNGELYFHQVLTQTSFAQVDPLTTGTGFTIRSWKNLDGPPALNGNLYATPTDSPLSVVKFEEPPQVAGEIGLYIYFTENFGAASSYRYVEHHAYNAIDDQLTVTTYANHDVGQSDKIIKQEVLDYDREEVIIFNSVTDPEFNLKKWTYLLTRVVKEAANDANGVMGALKVVKRTRETYGDLSPSSTGGEYGMRRLVEKIDDFGGANLKTRYDYYYDPNNQLVHGKLKSVTRPDGSWTYHEVTDGPASSVSQTVTYSSYLNHAIAQRAQAKKVVRDFQADSVTKTTYLAGVEVAKSVTTVTVEPNGDRKLSEKSETGRAALTDAYAATVTLFHQHGGNALQSGRRAWRKHPDGTYTRWTYAGSEEMLTITEETGAGDETKITEGTKTVTSYNAAYQPIDVQVYDLQADGNGGETETLISSRTTVGVAGGAVDPQGRHTKWQHFDGADASFTTTQYGCCGPELTIDRSGARTDYYRDALRRVYQTTMKRSAGGPMVTRTTVTDGLTTTRKQESGGETIFLGSSSRTISGLTRTIQSPDADGDGQPETTTSVTTYNVDPPAGTSKGIRTITTHPDSTTTKQYQYFDGRIGSRYDQEGNVTRYSYGTHTEHTGGETRTVNLPGNSESTTTFLDQLGRVFKMTYADHSETTQSYYPLNINTQNNPAGSWGKLKTATDPDGVTVTYAYNSEGERTTSTTPLPDDADGDPQARVTFSETTVVPSITIKGQTIAPAFKSVSEVNGIETNASYRSIDGRISGSISFGRESLSLSTVPADGTWTTTSTSPDGQKAVQTYTDGLLQKSESFSNLGTDPANADHFITSMSYTHDNFGRVLSQTDARTGMTTYDSDADGFPEMTDSGNLLFVKDSGNRITTFSYDNMGRRLSVDAPDTDILLSDGTSAVSDNITHTSYTDRGQTKATWGAQTYPRRYQYDEQGRMETLHTYQTIPAGEPTAGGDGVTGWVYHDQRGWLIEKNYDGETEDGSTDADYRYTAAGRLSARTWERGVVTSYGYEEGVLTSVTYTGESNGYTTPNLAYGYDHFGRITGVTRGGQAHANYTYDPVNLTLKTEHLNQDLTAIAAVLNRGYDILLRPKTNHIAGANGNLYQATYDYDTASRLEKVTNQANLAFEYQYEANAWNLIEKMTGPSHHVDNTWELTRNVLDQKLNVVPVALGLNDGLKSCYDYAVNEIGQRTSVLQKGQAFGGTKVLNWSYNARGELVQTDDTSSANDDRAYQYDAIGNREKSSETLIGNLPANLNYVANPLNQYTTVPSTSAAPAYDDDGNSTGYPLPAEATANSTLIWDAENRLVKATLPSGVVMEYEYDYLSRRIRKSEVGGESECYFYDGWNPIVEKRAPSAVGSFTEIRIYTWGKDLSGTMQGAGGVRGLLSIEKQSNLTSSPVTMDHFYPTYDGNGNVTQYLDGTGAVVAHYEYDGFGNITEENGTLKDEFDIRFSTKKQDSQTGLYYYGYRYYDPVTGRWPSRDPIEESGGVNLYGMVGNESIGLIDYLGLDRHNESYVIFKYGKDSWLERFKSFPRADQVTSLDEIVRDLQEKIDPYSKDGVNPCHCVEKLQINTHGSKGKIEFGPESGDLRSGKRQAYRDFLKQHGLKPGEKFDDSYSDGIREKNESEAKKELEQTKKIQKKLTALAKLMCEGGTIEINACSTGKGNEGAILEHDIERGLGGGGGGKNLKTNRLWKCDFEAIGGRMYEN